MNVCMFFILFSLVVPLSVPHATLVDTTLMGYAIPRKTFVLPSLYSVSLDPALWEEPKEFKPDRFIDSKGKLLKKEAFIPFSIGKSKQCEIHYFKSITYYDAQMCPL